MFVRVKKQGKYEYLQVVHGFREDGKVKQRILMTLGRVGEDSTYDNIDSLMNSMQKFSLRSAVLSSRNPESSCLMKIIGPVLVFERLWKNLGIGDAISKESCKRKYEFNVERAIFVSVLHRLLRTGSDLDCCAWKQRYEIKGSEGLELQHLYRAMGFLGERIGIPKQESPQFVRRIKDKIEETIYMKDLDVFSEFKMVFFDTTSMYFEGAGGAELGKRGYSKDSRPDLNQVIVGALLDEQGVPICCEVLPGNTADLKTLIPITERLKKRFGFWNFCIVADRGMISNPTLEHFHNNSTSMRFILGCRMRKDKIVKEFLQSQEINWGKESCIDRTGKERIYYKEIKLSEGQRHVICYSELQAKKDANTRNEIISQLQAKLNDDLKTFVKNAGYKRYIKSSGKKVEIDLDKIKSEEAYDGIWVLQTNTDLIAKDIVLRYKDLWQVEYVFRTMKSALDTRPIFHQRDERIVGHIFCSFLALVLKKELIKLLDHNNHAFTWAQIVDDLNSLGYIDISNDVKSIRVRTNVSGCA
ncbi:MAG: IS1634 family transposase, partial [Candidatus Subteraquimicrobiales bacterium]|nr:IS1634 family transposase [Candidatus Subteraquimicrobiales bacterium]